MKESLFQAMGIIQENYKLSKQYVSIVDSSEEMWIDT